MLRVVLFCLCTFLAACSVNGRDLASGEVSYDHPIQIYSPFLITDPVCKKYPTAGEVFSCQGNANEQHQGNLNAIQWHQESLKTKAQEWGRRQVLLVGHPLLKFVCEQQYPMSIFQQDGCKYGLDLGELDLQTQRFNQRQIQLEAAGAAGRNAVGKVFPWQ